MYLFKIGKSITAKSVIHKSPGDASNFFNLISEKKKFRRREDAHSSEHYVRAYPYKSRT